METSAEALPGETPAPRSSDRASVRGSGGGTRELLQVAIPLVLSSGSLSLMSAADRMILTGYSTEALAAVTPASMMHWTAVCIPFGAVLYANTFVSQCDGAGQRDRMMAWLWQSVWLGAVCGLLLIGLIPFSTTLLQYTGQSPEVIRHEADYFNVLCAGSAILLTSTALSCFFSGRRHTVIIMLVNLLGVLLNFVLNYILVYGAGPIPEMGIKGAALGTVLARLSDLIIYSVLIVRSHRREQLPWRGLWQPRLSLLGGYLKYGFPSGLHYFVDNSGFTVFLLIVGALSSHALAATNLAFSVNGLIFLPLLGFGTAVQTVVGHHLGAGSVRNATRTTWAAVRLGVLWTAAAGLVLIVLPDLVLQPFFSFVEQQAKDGRAVANYEGVRETSIILLRFTAVYSVFDALAVVVASALRGAGDTFFPMIITLCSSWLIMVLCSCLVLKSAEASVTKLWLCCSAHIVFMGIAMPLRFLTGRWKQVHLVEE
ncbi:MAG: MATE family efflux transporter [Planctomycetaceae bacterium]|nr:MATE family efflux transporter [Planctomycetaceae bacterium]